MSLNKFTDTSYKNWLNIGCDEIVCNELTVDGQKIHPNPLVFGTTSPLFSGSINPSTQIILNNENNGVGSMTSFGYSIGDQLRIVNRIIVNSPTAVNNVSISFLPMVGTQIQIPYSSYTTNTNIVVESIYTFVTTTQAYMVSTVYLPADIFNINHGLINFPSIVPYDLSFVAVSTAPSTLTMVQTTCELL
jgi:hypothetical protein